MQKAGQMSGAPLHRPYWHTWKPGPPNWSTRAVAAAWTTGAAISRKRKRRRHEAERQLRNKQAAIGYSRMLLLLLLLLLMLVLLIRWI